MDQPVLVKIYFDQYAGLKDIGDEAIVVTGVQSYAAARRAIEKVKAGEIVAPLTIVVRSRHFSAGFHDLTLLGDLAQSARIAPREEVARAFHVQLPSDLTDQALIDLGVQSPADLLAVAGPQGIHDQLSLEDALLAKAFGSQVFRTDSSSEFEDWFGGLIDLLYSEEAAIKASWALSCIRRLAEERTKVILESFEKRNLLAFVIDAMQQSAKGEVRIYLDQLAVRYWLSNYPKLARKAVIDNLAGQVGQWQEIGEEPVVLSALSPWCEALYNQDGNPLVKRLEQVLTLLLEEDDLIEEQDLSRYIQRTSGRFLAEYNAAQVRLGKLLLEQPRIDATREHRSRLSAYLAQLDSHFLPLLQKAGQPAKRASWVSVLLEFSDVISYLDEATPSHWADWLATYELLIRARHLRRKVQEVVPALYATLSDDQVALFSALDEKLNSQFADWLLAEYPQLVSSGTHHLPLVMNAARMALDGVAKGGRVVLLVLDALDWELWRHLRSAFSKQGFVVQGNEAGLAMVPTITEFSRRAIFGGLSPRNLANFVDDIYGADISPQEEAKTLARALGYLGHADQLKALPDNRRIQYLAGKLVYVNGSERDFRQALNLDARCYALVYAEIDSYIHDSKLAEPELKKTVRQWLEHLVEEIFKGIRQNPSLCDATDLMLIVASDHGFLDVSEQSQAQFEKPLRAFLDLERHGRLAIARVKSGEDKTSALQAVREFYDRHSATWHVIWQEQSDQFALAEFSPSEGEVVAWFMPRLLQYVSKGRGHYVHGGLSMYEAIVPLTTLSVGKLELAAPVITLTGRLISEEESTLSIAVLNQNDRPLQGIVVDIPELDLKGCRVEDIQPGSVGKLTVSVIPPRSGDMSVRVVLDGEMGGMRKRFEETRILTIQPGRRERMRLSTRRTFDEDGW